MFLLLTMAIGQDAQQKKDSMLKLLPHLKEDSAAVNTYYTIAGLYSNSDPATAKTYLAKSQELARELNYKGGIFNAYNEYGNVYLVEGKYDSALYVAGKSLEVAREMKDSLNIGLAYFNIGIFHRESSHFEKAIENCLLGQAIISKLNRPELDMQVNDALNILYYNRTEYAKGIEFGERAVKLARSLKSDYYLTQFLVNLSMPYLELNNLEKSRLALDEAMMISKKLGEPRFEAVITNNLAGIYLKMGKIKEARNQLEQSLALYQQVGAMDGVALNKRGIGLTYLQEKDFVRALEWGQQALAMDREHKFQREEASTLRMLSNIYYAMGNAEKGMEVDDQSNKILEIMVKDVLSKQSSDLEKKYETQKKEDQIRGLEAEKKLHQLSIRQKNIMNAILVGCAVVLVLVSLLTYRNYRQKQKLQQQRINELETEKKLMATEAVLKGEEQERTRLAKDLHDGLGGMLSGIKYSFTTMKGNLIMTPENRLAFERSMDMLDSSIKEMRRVAHNLMPENLVKFGLDTALRDFCNDINQGGALQVRYQSIGLADANIDLNTSINIYRIVQELINNVLKHAGARQAIVQVTRHETGFSVTVEDDGRGFDKNILDVQKGIGWDNIRSRVDLLKGKVDIQSEQGRGTSVHLELNA